MWQRRVEWHLLLPIAQVFRHTHPHMAKMEEPAGRRLGGRQSSARAAQHDHFRRGAWRDRLFVAGDRFTVADITGLVALDFARPARIAIPA